MSIEVTRTTEELTFECDSCFKNTGSAIWKQTKKQTECKKCLSEVEEEDSDFFCPKCYDSLCPVDTELDEDRKVCPDCIGGLSCCDPMVCMGCKTLLGYVLSKFVKNDEDTYCFECSKTDDGLDETKIFCYKCRLKEP